MLNHAAAVAAIPVTDLERSKDFYRDTLGLKEGKSDPSPGIYMEAGKGTGVYLYQRPPAPSTHTLAGFWVDDFDAEAEELRSKGIKFEEYDMPGLKTVNGIATMGPMKGAWFKDPDGNILSIGSM